MRTLPLLSLPLALFALHGCGGGPEDPVPGGGGIDDIERVSAGPAPTFAAGNGNSTAPTLSRNDRYVVYATQATNLYTSPVPDSTTYDVVLHDLDTGAATRVSTINSGSTAGSGAPVGGESTFGIASNDGLLVAFQSTATNLAAGAIEDSADSDVFVKNLGNDSTRRVQSLAGQPSGETRLLDMTPDGQYVLVATTAQDMGQVITSPADNNGMWDIYRWRVSDSQMVLISVTDGDLLAAGTAGGQNGATEGQISDDGLKVVFSSNATNLIGTATTGRQIFLRTIPDQNFPASGTTVILSTSSAGVVANGDCSSPTMSGGGLGTDILFAFASVADNLVVGDTNVASDVFVRNQNGPTTIRVSVATGGVQGANGLASTDPWISRDGAYVSFTSTANLLTAPDVDGNALADIYVHRLAGSITSRASSSTAVSGDANGASGKSRISRNGLFVVFESTATDLITSDGNAFSDIFVAPATPSGTG